MSLFRMISIYENIRGYTDEEWMERIASHNRGDVRRVTLGCWGVGVGGFRGATTSVEFPLRVLFCDKR